MFRNGLARVLFLAILLLPAASRADDVIPIHGTVPDAAFGRVTQGALRFLEGAAVEVINGMDIPGMIMAQNPIFTDNSVCDIAVNVTSVQYGALTFEIATTPFPGQPSMSQALYARMTIPNPNIGLRLDYNDCLFFSGSIDGTASGSSIVGTLIFQVVYDDSPQGARLGIAVSDISVALNDFSINLDLPWYLEPINWIIGTLEGVIGDQINAMIQQMIEEQLLPILEPLLDAIPLSGEVPIAMLNTSLLYDLKIQELTTGSNGLNLALKGSMYVEGERDCVDLGDHPGSRWTQNAAPVFRQTTPDGRPYHVGVEISDDLLNQVAYSTYSSGLLCLTLDTGILGGGFSRESLARLVPALARVPPDLAAADDTGGTAGPKEGDTVFHLQPSAPPVIDVMGGGQDLLRLSVQGLEFDMYEFVSERWVRSLGISLNASEDVGIQIADNLLNVILPDPQIDFEVIYNEYSGLDHDAIDALLQAALAAAWPKLLERLTGIELPAIALPGGQTLGYELVYAGPDGDGQDFLGAFLTFSLVSRQARRPSPRIVLEPRAGGRPVATDALVLDAAQSADYGLADALDLRIAMDAVPAPGASGPLSFSYRVDGGFWSRFSADPVARLPRLREGRHVFEARARGGDGAVARVPARLEFVSDGVAPRVLDVFVPEEVRAGARARVEPRSYDWQTPAARVRYSVRADGGDWSPFAPADELVTPKLAPGTHSLSVRAIDEAGNVSEPESATVEALAPRPLLACGVAGGSGGLLAALLALAALVLARPARRGK